MHWVESRSQIITNSGLKCIILHFYHLGQVSSSGTLTPKESVNRRQVPTGGCRFCRVLEIIYMGATFGTVGTDEGRKARNHWTKSLPNSVAWGFSSMNSRLRKWRLTELSRFGQTCATTKNPVSWVWGQRIKVGGNRKLRTQPTGPGLCTKLDSVSISLPSSIIPTPITVRTGYSPVSFVPYSASAKNCKWTSVGRQTTLVE